MSPAVLMRFEIDDEVLALMSKNNKSKTGVEPVSNSSIVRYAEEDIATRLAKLLQKISADKIEKYQQSKIYLFPFYVNASAIEEIDSAAVERLRKTPGIATLEFASETRFQDLSTVRFDSVADFLKKAGNRHDPESTSLTWSKFSLSKEGEPIAGSITIEFITEKKLLDRDEAPGEFYRAQAGLLVAGSNQDWVDETFMELEPHIETIQLGGIFRPLWIFRNKFLIQTSSMTISWVGFFIGINLASRLFANPRKTERSDLLEKLLNTEDVSQKLNEYYQYVFTPSKSLWWEPVVVVACGALTFALLYTIGMNLLPRLAPSSSIAVGLSSRRARQRLNGFKFVVFVVLISGVLIPLVLQLLSYLFTD